MKENDSVAVLICVHSQDAMHDRLLCKALDSLYKQSFNNFDVHIVFNDCWIKTLEME